MALSGMDELDRMTLLKTMLYYNYQSIFLKKFPLPNR